MKKMLLVLAITLLTTGLLFAAPSWLGVQGTASVKQDVRGKMFLPECGRDVLLSHGNDVFHQCGIDVFLDYGKKGFQ